MAVDKLRDALKRDEIKYILAQFVDVHGVAKTKAVPLAHLDGVLSDGAGFAGFAVDGLGIEPHGPDFMAVGDPASYRPMAWQPGFGRLACTGHVRGIPHEFDSRAICMRALATLRERTGCELFTGLEPEFFLLKRDPTTGAIEVGIPSDTLKKPCYDFRILSRASNVLMDLSDALIAAGIDVYQIDHEDANGQFEINFTYRDALQSADDFIFFKMAAAEIAHKYGYVASFMPKPFANRPGSGMHMHLSLGSNNKNDFLDESDPNNLGLSKLAYAFLAGILHHAPALTAIACPSVNSYKRLVGSGSLSGATWAPTSICYGDNNRTAMVRVPYGRLELRVPDAACNPYLLTAAVVAAGLDGIEKNLDAGAPTNLNLYAMGTRDKENAGIGTLPGTLADALDALERDEVLSGLLGNAFTADFIRLKREEWNDYHSHVSDWEVQRYLEFF